MATAISLVALALSVVSLSWQAWSWKNNGPMVKVHVTNAITDAVTGAPEHYVAVEAVNHGRAPTTITAWGFALPGGANFYSTIPQPISDALPCRLESHSKATFYLEADQVRQVHRERGIAFTDMRPWVDLGSGKRVSCKKTVPLAD